MSRFRKIDPRIWNDAKFRVMSDNAKLVLFLLLTHPNMTALGAMRATLPGLAAELGWSTQVFQQAFEEAARQGIVEHDEQACFIGLPKFLRYNKPESPNVVRAWARANDLLPECSFKAAAIQRARKFLQDPKEAFHATYREAFEEAFEEAFGQAMPYQEQEQEQEQEPQEAKEDSLSGELSPATVVAFDQAAQCPHVDIVALYHEVLPELTRVSDWTVERQRLLRKRWREKAERQHLEWWRRFFEYVRDCDFLMGRTAGRDGRPFECDLEWLVRPRNFLKVIEGKYQTREASA